MIVAIHQPNFCPWVPYFKKMYDADVFVYLDHAINSPQSWTHRMNAYGMMFTVPLKRETHHRPINAVEIWHGGVWQRKFVDRIRYQYLKHSNFDKYYPEIKQLLNRKSKHLLDYNMVIIKYIRSRLRIDTTDILSSRMDLSDATGTKLLREIIDKLNGDAYIMGADGTKYGDPADFNGIEILPTDYSDKRPILDLIFNEEAFQ